MVEVSVFVPAFLSEFVAAATEDDETWRDRLRKRADSAAVFVDVVVVVVLLEDGFLGSAMRRSSSIVDANIPDSDAVNVGMLL